MLLLLLNKISLTYSGNRERSSTAVHLWSLFLLPLSPLEVENSMQMMMSLLAAKKERKKRLKGSQKERKQKKANLIDKKVPRAERGGRFVYLSASPSPFPAKLLHCA